MSTTLNRKTLPNKLLQPVITLQWNMKTSQKVATVRKLSTLRQEYEHSISKLSLQNRSHSHRRRKLCLSTARIRKRLASLCVAVSRDRSGKRLGLSSLSKCLLTITIQVSSLFIASSHSLKSNHFIIRMASSHCVISLVLLGAQCRIFG